MKVGTVFECAIVFYLSLLLEEVRAINLVSSTPSYQEDGEFVANGKSQ